MSTSARALLLCPAGFEKAADQGIEYRDGYSPLRK